jgi:hypothetical protein
MILEEDKLNLKQKNPKAIKPHTYIISFVLELVLYIITHMFMAIKQTLNNNQYPWDWFKTHWVITNVIISDIFYATTLV